MSLVKINTQFLLILFLVFSNFWIYRIFKENFFLGAALITIVFTLTFFWKKKNSHKIILTGICVLLVFAYQTTKPQSLTILENDEQRVQQERVRSYPPTYLDLYFKVIWFKPADWTEKNSLIIGLSRVEKNLFENLNLNQYFFGGSPRNSTKDFEKFSFFLLPVFIVGIYKMTSDKKFKILFITFIFPLIFFSIFGNNNTLGPFALFPFFIISFVAGFKFLESYYKNKKIFYGSFVLFVTLGFIIQISYGQI